MIANVRSRLRSNTLVYRAVYELRRMRLDRHIAAEQARMERLAATRSTRSEDPFECLRTRLMQRGIVWPPETHGAPIHFLYASIPGNWERHNLPPELAKLGEVSCFFLKDEGWNGKEPPREFVTRVLPGFVRRLHQTKPVHMMLSYLSGAEITPGTIKKIAAFGIPTFSFHLDDRRAFFGRKIGGQWSGPAAVCSTYDLNLTNSPASLVKYRALGASAIFWPEAANPDFFRPTGDAEDLGVTFCGQNYGVRPLLVHYLRRNGVDVSCFGLGWENGHVNERELVKIFNRSKVNLGFGYVNESTNQCLKGRDFEIPACGAVYLSSANEDIARVYHVGREIEAYTTFSDCLHRVRALLSDPNRRAQLRIDARKAVVDRHTWMARVRQLLECECTPLLKY